MGAVDLVYLVDLRQEVDITHVQNFLDLVHEQGFETVWVWSFVGYFPLTNVSGFVLSAFI